MPKGKTDLKVEIDIHVKIALINKHKKQSNFYSPQSEDIVNKCEYVKFVPRAFRPNCSSVQKLAL